MTFSNTTHWTWEDTHKHLHITNWSYLRIDWSEDHWSGIGLTDPKGFWPCVTLSNCLLGTDSGSWWFQRAKCLILISISITEIYDRRDKPSVLVTSPGSPDLHSLNRATATRYANRLTPAGPLPYDPNVGGRIQVKLGFEAPSLQLIVTIICAAGLTVRANGVARNPYVKVSVLKFSFSFVRILTMPSTPC